MPSTPDRVSIVMPTYDDFDSMSVCLVANQMLHGQEVDQFVVVDNNPDSRQGGLARKFCEQNPRVKYVPDKGGRGTAYAKNLAVASAPSGYVVCIDSHVLLAQGAVFLLRKWLEANPDRKADLIHGPLLMDSLSGVNTHLSDVWSDGMKGQWAYDPQVEKKRPFEIQAMGMGCFVTHTDTWLKFHPDFRGFGGEEWYIQEKYRKHGRKVWCFPPLLWWHRFAKAHAMPSHPVTNKDKYFNYRTGWLELGLDVQEVDDHFATVCSPDEVRQVKAGEYQPHLQPQTCGGCGGGTVFPSWQAAETVSKTVKSDINEHFDTFRQYAAKSDVVLDVGSRMASTVALCGAKLSVYHLGQLRQADVESLAKLTPCKLLAGLPGQVEKRPEVPDHDLLFLDTDPHTANAVWDQLNVFAGKTRKYILLHDTAVFGKTGTDGQPGIRYAVAAYLKANPKWTKVFETDANNGLMVLSCLDEDKKEKKGTLTKIANFSKAKFKHLMAGQPETPDGIAQERLDECNLCEWRTGDECAACGCPVGKKVTFATEECPIGKWKAVSLPMV